MFHVVARIREEVVNHLDCLCMLNMDVLLLTDRFHEILMNELSDFAPLFAIIHDQKVVSLSDQTSHQRGWPIAVYVALSVQ